jgi:hypothetical protein
MALLFALTFAFVSPSPPALAASPLLLAAKGQLRAPMLTAKKGSHPLPFFSAGTLDAALSVLHGSSDVGVTGGTLGCSTRNAFDDGSHRVNQDCTFRRQAEETIAANPVDGNNLIAGQNDSRIGFNH